MTSTIVTAFPETANTPTAMAPAHTSGLAANADRSRAAAPTAPQASRPGSHSACPGRAALDQPTRPAMPVTPSTATRAPAAVAPIPSSVAPNRAR